MRQERQTALKETAELRRELNGGAGPLEPARLAEIHAQLDAKMAAATRRKEEMLRQEKRRKREANAARLSAAAARVANQREEKHRKIAGKVAGKEARREDLKDRSRGNRANIARRFDRPTNPDDASRTDGAVGVRAIRIADDARAPHWKPRRVGEHRDVDLDDPDRDASESAHSRPRSESDVDAASVASEISLSNGDGSAPPLSAHAPPRRLRTAPHVPVPYDPRGTYLSNVPIERTQTLTPRTTPRGRERAGWNDRTAVLDRRVGDAPARVDEVEKSNARVAALRAAAEARWNAVNTTAEAARREYGTPAGPTGRGVRGGEDENVLRSPTRGSSDENVPPTPPILAASSKGLRSSLDDADSRRSSEEFTFSPPPPPAAASLANLSALMSSARSSSSSFSSSSMKPFASTPTPNGIFSDVLSDDASIRESAMKVLDSPEAAAAAALSEELLARLEEESALMESLTESGEADVDGTGVAAAFIDPIDSWLAKAGAKGAKGVAESRELRLALASSGTHRDDDDEGGSEMETEEEEEEEGPGPGSPAWTVWANASMEARRDEDSPREPLAARLGFAAEDVNVACGGVAWLSPIGTATAASGMGDDRRTADSVPTALFRDEEQEPADEEHEPAGAADDEGFETVERGNARASIDDSPERRAAAAAKLLEDELEAASAIEFAAGEAARAAEARAAVAEEEAAKLAKEVADARARARAARAREEAEVRARAKAEAEAARIAASVQSAVDDDTLWRGRFGTSGGSGAKGAGKKERSPGKKERSPGKKERSPEKEERSPGKKERSPGKKEEPRLLAVRRLRRAARADGAVRTESDLARETDLRVRLGELESRLEATRRMRGVDLGENDGARDESWLEDARARSEPAGKRKGVDDDDVDDDDDESNPWFAPPSPDAEGSRLGAMPAAPTSNATARGGASNDDDDDGGFSSDGNESDTAGGDAGAVTSALRELEARELEEREVLGSNPQSAERRRRLEREEARELRELLRRQNERRRRRRRRLERRGEKVADFLPLFAAAALLGGAGRLVRGVFFGKKPGRG